MMIEQIFSSHAMRIVTTAGAALMALLVIIIRIKAAKYPTSMRKIIIPPLGMGSGFLMFIFPAARVPISYALISFAAGLMLALPLIRTTQLHKVNGEVYVKRSPAFILVLFGLLIFRMLLHPLVEEYVTLAQSGGLFFILAFGMIALWRIMMAVRYRKIVRETDSEQMT